MKAFAILMLAFVLSACTGWPAGWDDNKLDTFIPAAPSTFARTMQVSLVMQFVQGGHTLEFPVELVLAEDRMSIAIFSPIGGALATAVFDGTRIEQRGGSALPAPLQGGNLLRQVQLAIWPAEPLAPVLLAQGIDIVDGEEGRSLIYQGQPVIQIHRQWPDFLLGKVEFTQLRQHYHWSMTPVQIIPLDANTP